MLFQAFFSLLTNSHLPKWPWQSLGGARKNSSSLHWVLLVVHPRTRFLLPSLCVLLLLCPHVLFMIVDKIPEANSVPSLLRPFWILPFPIHFTTLPVEVHIGLLVGGGEMIPVPNPCGIHLPPAPQEAPNSQVMSLRIWLGSGIHVIFASSQSYLLLPALPHPTSSHSPKHSSRVTSLKEQGGFGAVSASTSCSWPSQQLGRDFQVLALSVLLLPWLQTSSVTLVWSSWIPAGCSLFLQPVTESCPSKTKAAGGGFHHFCLKLHLGVLLCYSDYFILPYLVLSDPFKFPFKNLFIAFLNDLLLSPFHRSNPIPQSVPLL